MHITEEQEEQGVHTGGLHERLGVAGYGGFALLIAGGVFGGTGGIALASLGLLTVVLTALFFAFLFITKRQGTQSEG